MLPFVVGIMQWIEIKDGKIKLAYDLLTKGKGESSQNLTESIQNSYNNGITDEFIKPIISVDENGNPDCKNTGR